MSTASRDRSMVNATVRCSDASRCLRTPTSGVFTTTDIWQSCAPKHSAVSAARVTASTFKATLRSRPSTASVIFTVSIKIILVPAALP